MNSLSPDDAARSLSEIEKVEARSGRALGYQFAAPHFFLWGVVWMLGYGLSDLRPGWSKFAWPILILAALVTIVLLPRPAKRGGWRAAVLLLVLLGFVAATFAVLGPVSDRQQAAFIPLIVAAIQIWAGLYAGLRYALAGAIVAALTLGGYFLLREHFLLWMALVGGGGLILTGIWFRRV